MATIPRPAGGFLAALLRRIGDSFAEFGDLSAFGGEVIALTFRRPARGAVTPIFYAVGVRSIPVVAVTGLFIGMVLAVQSYAQFHSIGMATRLGSIINMSVVRELGPVLAATMLAGRVGGAMAAELATMRITEQIDAMACLGTNPVHRLAVPRFMACVLLIPLLTTVANFMGVMGGALVCTQVYNVDAHFYWQNAAGLREPVGRDGGPDQADVLRRRDRHHRLSPRLPRRRRRRGRRPGRDAGVRVVVHRHPGAGLLPGAVPQQPPRLLWPGSAGS